MSSASTIATALSGKSGARTERHRTSCSGRTANMKRCSSPDPTPRCRTTNTQPCEEATVTALEMNANDAPTDQEGGDYELARKRLQAKRDFASHLVVFVVVNAFFVGIWALTGGGYFWPAWVIGCWGAGLVLHAWETYFHRPVTDADVKAELDRS